MRLAGCLAVEACVAAALVAGAAVGGARAVDLVRGSLAARGARIVAAAAGRPPTVSGGGRGLRSTRDRDSAPLLQARQELSGEPAGDAPSDTAGTFLGMSDELLLERLRTQPVTRLKLNRGGSSLSFRVDFADGSRAAWKPAQTNTQTIPRKEVAAYRLNKLLGLNAVPPAVQRSLPRDDLFSLLHPDSAPFLPRIRAETIIGPGGMISGEASYWIPVIKDSPLDTPAGHAVIGDWLTQRQPIPFESRSFAAQVARLVVFDFLIANPDRYSGGNMKVSASGEQLFFMDNTMSFFLDSDGPEKTRQVLYRTQRFSRGLHHQLAQVDLPTLRRLMHEADGPDVLTDAEMRAVVQRRELVQRYITDLAKLHGEPNVLFFP